ncbi:MAG: family 10 glycosylhydrolase, partial [Firmicutes bacterium]|nr:family 10 glycosylhydrolase [Bacillota bacterium]
MQRQQLVERTMVFSLCCLLLGAAMTLLAGVPAVAAPNYGLSTPRVMDNLIHASGLEGRILWMDLKANLERLNSREKVAAILDKVARANINTVAVGVKHSSGFTTYQSRLAPHISQWITTYPADYDLLKTMIEEAHRRKIKVHAALDIFTEGLRSGKIRLGPVFEHPEWESVVYTVGRELIAPSGARWPAAALNQIRYANSLVIYTPGAGTTTRTNQWGTEVVVANGVVVDVQNRIGNAAIPADGCVLSGHGEAEQFLLANFRTGDPVRIDFISQLKPISGTGDGMVYVNPLYPAVGQHVRGLLTEIVKNYDVDGIILDRARYTGLNTDFSDYSRRAFEQYLGAPVAQWPEDIYSWDAGPDGLSEQLSEGPLFKPWLAWRAGVIRDFVQKAESAVHAIRPEVHFADYVGSWYPLYYTYGVNWGSAQYLPEYDWAAPEYAQTGYAGTLDFLMSGLYYPEVTKEEAAAIGSPADWYSVEGAAELTLQVTMDDT